MQLIYKKLKDILDVIKIANSSIDRDVLRNNILDAFSDCFSVEKSVFILQESTNHRPDFMLRNLDEKKCSEYIEYYYRLDPFKQFSGSFGKGRLLSGPFPHRDVVDLRELVEYPAFLSDEFYNDFYRPQKIFWELGAFLKSVDGVLGYIGLFRPQDERGFSKEEMRLLGTVSPYITLAIENMELRRKSEIEGLFFDLFERHSNSGLIICDEALKVLCVNRRARDYCSDPGRSLSIHDAESSVPDVFLTDCREIKEAPTDSSVGLPVLPLKRIVNNRSVSYAICTKCIDHDSSPGLGKLYVIQIDPLLAQRPLDEERIEALFHLTKRETEITRYILEGFKNAEIAERLFISEVTVKKHVQHICRKMDVSHRTALIHKTLTSLNII